LIYWIVLFFKWRGFDFETFDPANPETLGDTTTISIMYLRKSRITDRLPPQEATQRAPQTRSSGAAWSDEGSHAH
jgi:hypothetical protein